jgi:S1-C subfamily serine protease
MLDPNPPEGRKGIRLQQVVKDGAASKAGLQDGDIITIFHGVELKDFSQLREELDRLEPGEKVIVSVYRPSKDGERDFTIVLGSRPDGEE